MTSPLLIVALCQYSSIFRIYHATGCEPVRDLYRGDDALFKIFASSLIAMMLLSSCSQRVVEQPKESAPPVRLSAVYSTSDYVWVAGQGGIWRSSDRGSSWVKQHDTNLNVDSLFFVDDQHGWANEGETLLRGSWTPIGAPAESGT